MKLLTLARKAEPALNDVGDSLLYNAIVQWMFRGTSSRAFGARLSKLSGTHVKAPVVTEALMRSHYLLRYKVYLLGGGKMPRSSCGLPKTDRIDAFTSLSPLSRQLVKRLRNKYGYECYADVCEQRDRCTEQLMTWCAKFVYRKMRFVSVNQRLGKGLDDLQHDLLLKAVQAYGLSYPIFHSELHAVNVMKRTAHNIGINIIKHSTRKKVSGTMVENGANVSRIVSIEDALEEAAPEQNPDLRIDISTVVDKYKGKRRTFLLLLAGAYSKEFSKWLKRDNDEYIDRVPASTYIRRCLEWLGVSLDAGLRFLNKIRMELSGYEAVVA